MLQNLVGMSSQNKTPLGGVFVVGVLSGMQFVYLRKLILNSRVGFCHAKPDYDA